jgi:predicted flap endonuclease-1-like 5' DNA nuclease
LLAVIAVWFLYTWLTQKPASEPKGLERGSKATPNLAQEAAVTGPPLAAPDELVALEGIGPKIDNLLRKAGITTFAELAGTDVQELRQILAAADLRLADPTTWPEQARLAAAGKWGELQALQDQLKAGRSEKVVA